MLYHERRMTRFIRVLLGFTSVSVLVVVGLGGVVESSQRPAVRWNPRALGVTVLPGDTRTQQVDLIVRGKRNNPRRVHLAVSAELAPYVSSLSQAEAEALAGVEQLAHVSFDVMVPLGTPPGTSIAGSLDVQTLSGGGALRTQKRFSLPVTISVIGLTAPAGWRLEPITADDPQSRAPRGGAGGGQSEWVGSRALSVWRPGIGYRSGVQ